MSKFNMSSAKKAQYAQWAILALLVVVLAGVAFGFLLQFLWNIVVVDVFSVAAITFWQAVGLFVIAKLFFGFGVGGSSHRSGSKSHRSKKHWAKEFSRRDSSRDKSADTPDAEPDASDGLSLDDDIDFQEFWAAEGKASYDAYRAGQKGQD